MVGGHGVLCSLIAGRLSMSPSVNVKNSGRCDCGGNHPRAFFLVRHAREGYERADNIEYHEQFQCRRVAVGHIEDGPRAGRKPLTKNCGKNHGQREHDCGDPKTLKQVSPLWPRAIASISRRAGTNQKRWATNITEEYNQEDKPEKNKSAHEMAQSRSLMPFITACSRVVFTIPRSNHL